MKSSLRFAASAVGLPALASSWLFATLACAQPTPTEIEKEVLRISKYLKPIPDKRWEEIAGPRISEKYEISKGDTLYDVSHRLFGDAKYWPKIWALNNASITNPHRIFPGRQIAFLPGSGSDLPALTLSDSDEPDRAKGGSRGGTSEEWKKLPPQRWERVQIRIRKREITLTPVQKNQQTSFKFELQAVAATEPIESLGIIEASDSPAVYLYPTTTVFIHSKGKLDIGETYSVSRSPESFLAENGRTGYSHLLLGTVRITDLQNGVYVGKVISAKHWFTRGSAILPLQPRVPLLEPIPAPSEIRAQILIDHTLAVNTVAAGKEVFLNVGTEDGIRPGMVFRAYVQNDPSTGSELAAKNTILAAELMVVQVSKTYSAAIIVSSQLPISEGLIVTAVMNAASLQGIPALQQNTEDELEKLEGEDKLGPDEERELRQLEKWKGNPEKTPSDALPPPEGPPAEVTPPQEVPTAPLEELPPPPGELPPVDLPPPPGELPPAPNELALPPSDLPPPPAEGTGVPADLAPPADLPPPPPSDESKALEQMLGK